MDEKFGFYVAKVDYKYGPETVEYDGRGGPSYVKHDLDPPNWLVALPHQCDSWDIAGEYGDGEPQADAIAELERFIAEAQEALAALREGREFGDPDA